MVVDTAVDHRRYLVGVGNPDGHHRVAIGQLAQRLADDRDRRPVVPLSRVTL